MGGVLAAESCVVVTPSHYSSRDSVTLQSPRLCYIVGSGTLLVVPWVTCVHVVGPGLLLGMCVGGAFSHFGRFLLGEPLRERALGHDLPLDLTLRLSFGLPQLFSPLNLKLSPPPSNS